MADPDVKIERQADADGRGMAYVPGEGGGSDDPRAAMTYHHLNARTINIDHTEVDDGLRGEGVGLALLENLVSLAREKGWAVEATCAFAVAQFDEHPEFNDVHR